jgi:hypothetical protein
MSLASLLLTMGALVGAALGFALVRGSDFVSYGAPDGVHAAA